MPNLLRGKYELLHLAGEGGMAHVFEGRTHGAGGFSRPIAIKKIVTPMARDPRFLQMFVEEARVVSTLHHPNIAQIHDFDEDVDGSYFLILEWVEGVHLSHWRKAHAAATIRTPWDLIAAIIIEVLGALDFAHRRFDASGRAAPVIHRDVTPQNIMVTTGGYVKLTDFGLARALDRARVTQPGIVKGKLAYTAPELTYEADASPRSDIYSVGVVAWELLTGRKLVTSDDPADVIREVRRAQFPSITELRPDVPRELVRVVEHAMALDVERRFETARDMSQALRGVLRHHGAHHTDAEEIAASVRWVIDQDKMCARSVGAYGAAARVDESTRPPTRSLRAPADSSAE